MWSQILVSFSAVLALIILLKRINYFYKLFNLFVIIPFLSIAITFLASTELDTHIYIMIRDWSSVVSISFILIILLKIIRDLKPVFERYPAPFIFTPLILLPVYPFLNDAEVIKNLLNMMLQGGALLVFILISITIFKKLDSAWNVLVMILSLTGTYITYWFIPELSERLPWIWHLFLTLGLISAAVITPQLLNITNKPISGATL